MAKIKQSDHKNSDSYFLLELRLLPQRYESYRSSPWKKAYMFTILCVKVSEIFKLLKTKAMNLWPESCYSRTPDH